MIGHNRLSLQKTNNSIYISYFVSIMWLPNSGNPIFKSWPNLWIFICSFQQFLLDFMMLWQISVFLRAIPRAVHPHWDFSSVFL